ncbi:hypothetical protein [Streptomyces sp. NPDC058401]|uniref:hypothetical protein n=1 Tax=Streptomyces sp. NPDC058401 TaxID=3346480 RepID=UPI003648D7CC
MADLTPEQMRRTHDFAEQLSELAEHQEDQWKVQTTDGQISLTMMSPTAPHGLNVVVSGTNSLTDIRDKLHDYPKMGVPLYVVVDPRKDEKTATVHSDPSEGPDGIHYRRKVPYSFGDTVIAGRWTLDTSGLNSYPADW